MSLPVHQRDEQMYDCFGWVRACRTLFSRRKSWYMRLLGSTLTLQQRMDTPVEMEFSVISCKVLFTFLPRCFTIKLSNGGKLFLGFESTEEASKWKNALRRASVLSFANQLETVDEIENNGSCALFHAIDKEFGTKHIVHRIAKNLTDNSVVRNRTMGRHVYSMLNMNHENILWASEVFNEAKYLYLITSPIRGKRLETYACNKNQLLSEAVVRMIAKALVSAIHYLHGKGYVHRNVEAENIWVDLSDVSSPKVVLSNFDNVAFVEDEEDLRLRGQVGNVRYCAPEVVGGNIYNASVDMYALGVCLYRLFSGSFPFEAEGGDVKENIASFEEMEWLNVSTEAKSFVQSLLEPSWKNRMTSKIASRHSWLSKKEESPKKQTRTVQGQSQEAQIGLKTETEVTDDSSIRAMEIKNLLKQDKDRLTSFMQRLLSPISNEPPIHVKSPVDVFANNLRQRNVL